MTRRHRSLAHLYRASVCRMAAVALMTLPVVFTSMNAAAQEAEEKPGVDVIIFTNGDQLTGTLVSESDSTVVFHSDMTGDVNVDWKKVKSLHTGGKYAVIKSDEKLRVGKPAPQIPVGTLSASNDEVSVAGVGGEVKNVPTKDIAYVVKSDDFQKAIAHEPGFEHDWTGGITLGASLVESTQTSENFTGAIALVRTEPGPDWLLPRNKTIFDATGTYGLTTQPFIPGVQSASSARTNILHGDIERDQYLTPRFYLLADASADHNIGSGLQVQQIYGGGAGYSIIKEKMRTLDVKGDIHYQKQDFYPAADFPSGNTLNLIGATIGEMYMQQLPKGLVFNETGTILPAFNTPAGQPSALSAQIIAGLLFPVYKNLGFTLTTQDNFVNNPPLGYKKNTFQFAAGVTYTLK
jgi:sporulation protein YlmC with PRC-barrel domain